MGFYLYKILENVTQSLVTKSRQRGGFPGPRDGNEYKGHREISGDGYVHFLDCGDGDGVQDVCISQTHQIVRFIVF